MYNNFSISGYAAKILLASSSDTHSFEDTFGERDVLSVLNMLERVEELRKQCL